MRSFVQNCARLCQPQRVHVCDGSDKENEELLKLMHQQGMIEPLSAMDNW